MRGAICHVNHSTCSSMLSHGRNAARLSGSLQMRNQPKVLIYSPSVKGGIAEHTFYQARALKKTGAKVVCLVPASFLAGRKTDFEQEVCLPHPFAEGLSGIAGKLCTGWSIIY